MTIVCGILTIRKPAAQVQPGDVWVTPDVRLHADYSTYTLPGLSTCLYSGEGHQRRHRQLTWKSKFGSNGIEYADNERFDIQIGLVDWLKAFWAAPPFNPNG